MYASPAKNYALKFFERGNHLVMSVALVAGNFYAMPVRPDCQRVY